MFYKIECYIEVKSSLRGEQVAKELAVELGYFRSVKDHCVVSGKCTAAKARSAGLLRTTQATQNAEDSTSGDPAVQPVP